MADLKQDLDLKLDLDAWGENNVWDYDSIDGQGVCLTGCTTDRELLGVPQGKWDISVDISNGKLTVCGKRRKTGEEMVFEAPIEVRLLSPLKRIKSEDPPAQPIKSHSESVKVEDK